MCVVAHLKTIFFFNTDMSPTDNSSNLTLFIQIHYDIYANVEKALVAHNTLCLSTIKIHISIFLRILLKDALLLSRDKLKESVSTPNRNYATIEEVVLRNYAG